MTLRDAVLRSAQYALTTPAQICGRTLDHEPHGRDSMRLRFLLAHLVPRVHWTTYRTDDGTRRMAVWRQWGTRCWDISDVAVR